jgi:hypothetical protein
VALVKPLQNGDLLSILCYTQNGNIEGFPPFSKNVFEIHVFFQE